MIINATAYPTGYLASSYMVSARGGVATCSWRLDAQSGMHVRLSVLDYAVSRQVAPGSYDCLTFVDVDDDGPPYDSRKVSLCTGNTTAIRTASSKSYQVTVRMSHSGRPNDAHYLVKYEGRWLDNNTAFLKQYTTHDIEATKGSTLGAWCL